MSKHGLKYLCVGAKFQAMSENPQAIQDAIKLSDLFETDYIDIDTLPVENRKSVEGYKEYAKKLNAVGAEVKKRARSSCIILMPWNSHLSGMA